MITLADEYTVALGVTAVAAYIVSRLLVPPSLVHPLLLGRQSHVAAVRKEGESTAYTNYGIGSSQVILSLHSQSSRTPNGCSSPSLLGEVSRPNLTSSGFTLQMPMQKDGCGATK